MKRTSALSVLLLLAALLASCGESAAAPVETASGNDKAAVTETEAVTEEVRIDPELPEKDLGGYDFRVITKGTENVHWKSKDIYAESLNGEPINDAVFTRNSKLGEKYNFKVTEIPSKNGTWDVHTEVQKSVLAGEDAFSMAAMSLTGDLSTLAAKNCLYNLYDIPYINLERPWYDQKVTESMSIGGRLFSTTGDMILMDNEATYGILFNKRLAEELDLGNFYDTVRDGKWTIDKLLDACKLAVADLNGDGVHDEFDRWGICGEPADTFAYMVGMGEMSVKKDADDLPYFVLQNDRFYSAFEKSIAINGDFDLCMYSNNYPKYTDVWAECIDKAFIEGRLLFTCAGLVRVTVFRTMDIDFGIIPLPKYDEAQTDYCSFVSIGCSDSIAIPAAVQDTEAVGLIIEAMSAESMYTLTPAYYDVVIKGKAARDVESLDMLDLIFSNRIYDLGYSFDWGGIITEINNLTTNKAPNISSSIEKKLKSAQKALDKTITTITESEG